MQMTVHFQAFYYFPGLKLQCGHSNYQIGVNRTKSKIPTIKSQFWKLCPQLHHCIRSTFSRYWITQILNIRVQNWLNIATHTYDNRNVLNKGDDELRW